MPSIKSARHPSHHADAKPRLGTRGRPDQSRSAILKAAAREFAENGIAGARTDTIAHDAHVNKALIYYYFKDKETLYGAVLDHAFSSMHTEVAHALNSDLPPRRKLLAYVGTYFDFIAAHSSYPKLMQREAMRARDGHSPHIDRLIQAYFHPINRRLTDLIVKGMAEGEFRAVDPSHFVSSMIGMIIFYFNSAPIMRKVIGFNPLSSHQVALRRASILDFISAALFVTPAPQEGRL